MDFLSWIPGLEKKEPPPPEPAWSPWDLSSTNPHVDEDAGKEDEHSDDASSKSSLGAGEREKKK